jgi:GNAT superfamily N-acetyltransferase
MNINLTSRIKLPKDYSFSFSSNVGNFCNCSYEKIELKKCKCKHDYFFYIKYRGNQVGSIHLEYQNGGIDSDISVRRWITHSNIQYDHRNKGLGVLLYSRAIEFAHKNKIKLGSYPWSSNDAKRVWESKRLRKRFIIRKYCIRDNYNNDGEVYYAYKKNNKAKNNSSKRI